MIVYHAETRITRKHFLLTCILSPVLGGIISQQLIHFKIVQNGFGSVSWNICERFTWKLESIKNASPASDAPRQGNNKQTPANLVSCLIPKWQRYSHHSGTVLSSGWDVELLNDPWPCTIVWITMDYPCDMLIFLSQTKIGRFFDGVKSTPALSKYRLSYNTFWVHLADKKIFKGR